MRKLHWHRCAPSSWVSRPNRRARHLAWKLFDAVSIPLEEIGKLRLAVRPSIGITMCPAD